MNLKLGTSWTKKLEHNIERYQFEVGILNDKPHKDPAPTPLFGDPSLGTYAGGPVRKTGTTISDKSTAEILIDNMRRMNINLLLRPFQEKNSDILKFTDYFLRLVTGRQGTSEKRIENLLQAIVRNPILKQEYGPNRASTADAKGFNRKLIDTGQMFKAIRARVIKRV